MNLRSERIAGLVSPRVFHLDSDDQLLHLAIAHNLDFEFLNRPELPDDILDRTGKHVNSPDNQHSVSPSQDASSYESLSPAALALTVNKLDQVAGSVPNQGAANSPQIGHYKLAALSSVYQRGRPASLRFNHLRDELVFDDVHVQVVAAAIAPGSQLRSSSMINAAGAPGRFDAILDVRHARAGFTRMYSNPHTGPAQVHTALPRRFRKP